MTTDALRMLHGAMTRLAVTFGLALAALLQGCAPPTLIERAPNEQRALGEAAVAKVCGYALDVETPIHFGHRYNLNLARQYLDDVIPADLPEGELSRYFTLETIRECAVDLEWGGVNFDVQRLVKRIGTESEVRTLLAHSLSIADECRFDGQRESATFVSTCHAMGFAE